MIQQDMNEVFHSHMQEEMLKCVDGMEFRLERFDMHIQLHFCMSSLNTASWYYPDKLKLAKSLNFIVLQYLYFIFYFLFFMFYFFFSQLDHFENGKGMLFVGNVIAKTNWTRYFFYENEFKNFVLFVSINCFCCK